MKKEKYRINVCPICGEMLVKIDDMNYFTSLCPQCHSAVFEELDGTLHVTKSGIAQDGYNVSLDIFYKQLVCHQMAIEGKFGDADLSEIMRARIFRTNIYNEAIYSYFAPMTDDFKMRQPYIYFNGYEKYFKMSDEYVKETFPWLFK